MRAIPFLLATTLACAWATASAQAPAGASPQDPAVLVAHAEALIRDRAASYPGRVVVSVTPPAQFNQPACSQLEATLAGSGLQPRTSVALRCLAPRPWTTYLQASVQIVGPYLVASRAIQRGEALAESDLDTREGDLLRNRRLISDPQQALGWITTRNIRAGAPIESQALRDPNAVQRGQQVRTIARGAGFVATSEGQAMGSGGPGAQIQVRTPNGQIITGTVIDGHTVQVMM